MSENLESPQELAPVLPESEEEETPEPVSGKKSRYWRVIHFPITRIFILLGLMAATVIPTSLLLQALVPYIDPDWPEKFQGADPLSLILGILVCHLVYTLFVRVFEEREVYEFSKQGALKELTRGILIGAGFITSIVTMLWLFGYYTVSEIHPVSAMIPFFLVSIQAGYLEELIMRGILFRLLEETIGSWLALIITALLFGFGHQGNPNATLFSSAAISIEAGVLLAAAYMVTRRLWLVIGMHFAWNFFLGGVYGSTVSGIKLGGLMESKLTGPDIMTGGTFGIEASIITVFLGLLIGTIFLMKARQANRILPPLWVRRRDQESIVNSQ